MSRRIDRNTAGDGKNYTRCDEHCSVDEEYVDYSIEPTERIFEPPAEVSRQC